jgi:hypothetical protein
VDTEDLGRSMPRAGRRPEPSPAGLSDSYRLSGFRPVPSESRPRGPEMSRPRLHSPYTAYHEAGHAVAFWHHGVPFRYATLEPRIPGNAGHVYGIRLRPAVDSDGLAKEMRFAAAGDIAYGRIMRSSQVPADAPLLRRFIRAAANPEDPFLSADERNFISAALRRDAMLSVEDAGQAIGPSAWLGIWRDTEQLIRVTLWPAVYAVAWEMVFSSRALTYPEVALIAEAGMAQAGAEAPDG